jgi:hypothetical protein
MHQPIDHLYRPGWILMKGGIFLAEIFACCAPGSYLVEDLHGHMCITSDRIIEKYNIEMVFNEKSYWDRPGW